jgi:hypothetical protein
MTVRLEGMLRQALFFVTAWMTVMMTAAGCGAPIRTVPVTGTVTFGGQPPPYGCVVNFLPMGGELPGGPGQDSGSGVAAGMGECNAAGLFSVFCLRDRRGLIPGRYEVSVSCYEPVKTPFATPVSVVPADFKAPELVVPADARSVRYDLDVPAAVKN